MTEPDVSPQSCVVTSHAWTPDTPGVPREATEIGRRAKGKRQGKRGRVEEKGGSDRWGGHMEKEVEPSKGVRSETCQESRGISEVQEVSRKE